MNEKVNVLKYAALFRNESWLEGKAGKGNTWIEDETYGMIGSDAIQKALDENAIVYIPSMNNPLYIDRPIILNSGNSLLVAHEAEIRLKPGTNSCMIRNKNLAGGHEGEIDPSLQKDTDINVEGGIWNAMNNGIAGGNGNARGNSEAGKSYYGAHGTFLFNNISNIRIRNVVIKECTSFAVHMSVCSDFVIENVQLAFIYRDGIHINGPADRGLIRNISGRTGDDIIALNAWDWQQYAMAFGTISHVRVEDIVSEPGYLCSEIRLLAGTKQFADGSKLACDIRNCSFRNIQGIHTVKMYAQPNLEYGRANDYSAAVGYLENILFEDIQVDYLHETNDYWEKGGVFEVCADIRGLEIRNIKVNYPLSAVGFGGVKLLAAGPISGTWKTEKDNAATWVEIFEPDAVCKVEGLVLADIYHKAVPGRDNYVPCKDILQLILERRQLINPDYPLKTPRGGTGYGQILDYTVL